MNTATPTFELPLNGEKLITLDEAAARYPSHHGAGKRMHRNTLKRRAMRGVKHPATGELVKLETTREGRRLLTSWEAVARWEHAMNSTDPKSAPAAKKPSGRSNAGEALKRMGA